MTRAEHRAIQLMRPGSRMVRVDYAAFVIYHRSGQVTFVDTYKDDTVHVMTSEPHKALTECCEVKC